VNNVYGVALTEGEQRLVECYRSLAQVLADHRDELAPYQERNALKALAALWQIANGLDMEPGQIYHLGA
jgi:hypothetical protein